MRFLKFTLLSFAISLLFGCSSNAGGMGRAAVKNNAAVQNVVFVTANDSTCSDTKYYSQSGSDLDTLSYTNQMSSSIGAGYTYSQGENSYTAQEIRANKNYNWVYRPFFIYPQEVGQVGIPKASQYTINVSFTLRLTKSASGGGARAFAELFFLGNGNNKPEPSIINNSFDTLQDRNNDTSTSYNNATDSSKSIGVFTNKANTPISTTSISQSIVFKNDSPTQNNVVRYQLGLLVGCNYASSYDHTAIAEVTMNISAVSKDSLVARVGSDSYASFNNALAAFNSGRDPTLTLLRDVNVNAVTEAYRVLSNSGTIDLNGFTLTSNNTYAFSITNNATVTITGGNISHTGNQYAISTSAGTTLNINSGVTITSSSGGGIFNNGTLTSSATISTPVRTLNNVGTATLNNSTLSATANGSGVSCVQNSGLLMINSSTLNAPSDGKSLLITSASANTAIYGSSSLPRGISVNSGCNAQKLYLYYVKSTYTGSAINLTFADSLANGNIPVYLNSSSDINKINITNSLASYLEYNYNSTTKAYAVQYKKFTLTVNMSHGTYVVTKTTNIIYTDSVIVTCTLDTGFELLSSGVVSTGCNRSFSQDTLTITLTNFTSNPQLTITPQLMKFKIYYDGNGYTNITSNYNKAGYATNGLNSEEYYGTSYTVLDFAIGKTNHKFVSWNTAADGSGEDYLPGEQFTITQGLTLYAKWTETAEYIISTKTTRKSLSYYYKEVEGGFAYKDLIVRFGGIVTKDLWDELNSESTILSYGFMFSTDEYLKSTQLKSRYNTATPTNQYVQKYTYSLQNKTPYLYEDINYEGVNGDYYVWNLAKEIEEANYTTVYASVAFIETEAGVVFFEEVRESVKTLAQGMINSGEYAADSFDGSLNYLANLA